MRARRVAVFKCFRTRARLALRLRSVQAKFRQGKPLIGTNITGNPKWSCIDILNHI